MPLPESGISAASSAERADAEGASITSGSRGPCPGALDKLFSTHNSRGLSGMSVVSGFSSGGDASSPPDVNPGGEQQEHQQARANRTAHWCLALKGSGPR